MGIQGGEVGPTNQSPSGFEFGGGQLLLQLPKPKSKPNRNACFILLRLAALLGGEGRCGSFIMEKLDIEPPAISDSKIVQIDNPVSEFSGVVPYALYGVRRD